MTSSENSPYPTPPLPIPPPLRGEEPGTFAHYSITVRLPGIVRRALAENELSARQRAQLEALLSEIPYSRVLPVDDPQAPDFLEWQEYTGPYLGQNWLEAPWFFMETYLFRRIIAAMGYYQEGAGRRTDPYWRQKELGLEAGRPAIPRLAAEVAAGLAGEQRREQVLARLLRQNLWGNQADLSMWPAGTEGNSNGGAGRGQTLVDHAEIAAAYLGGLAERPARVDFILDNTGLELIYDLGVVDFMLSSGLASEAIFHLKMHPTFVSDVTRDDIAPTLEAFKAAGSLPAAALAGRLEDHLHSGRLKLTSHPYWTSPLSFWELPAGLRRELGRSGLLVVKGDANYRRLLGDRHWPFTTPLEAILRYSPAPLTALRVLKSEVAAGLNGEQVAWLQNTAPNWMIDGQAGVIQFVPGSEN